MLLKILQDQSICPILLMQVQKHSLFEFSLAEVDGDGVVVSVQAMDQCLNRRLVQVTNIGGRLTRFLAHHCNINALSQFVCFPIEILVDRNILMP